MSTIKANTLLHSDGSTTNPPAIPALDQRMAKAWVNFNGTSTVAIRGSYNVSSVTDNSTGNYNVNFSTNMTNANYTVTFAVGDDMANTTLHNGLVGLGSYRIHNKNDANSFADTSIMMCNVFGS